MSYFTNIAVQNVNIPAMIIRNNRFLHTALFIIALYQLFYIVAGLSMEGARSRARAPTRAQTQQSERLIVRANIV